MTISSGLSRLSTACVCASLHVVCLPRAVDGFTANVDTFSVECSKLMTKKIVKSFHQL